jgi:SAP domain
MPTKRKAVDTVQETAWAEQTVSSIKEELDRRGLSKAGKKADLVARLDADDAASAAATKKDKSVSVAWAEQTVALLKEELERRGLSKAGKKADLVARLEAADSEAITAEAPDPGPRAKKQKKGKDSGSDAELDGQTAAELVGCTDRSRSGEVRARPFVPSPNDEYRKKFKRVKSERMFMLDRTKTADKGGVISEIFDIAGSTGNIYQTTIGRSPRCTCMDAVSILSGLIYRPNADVSQRIRGQKCKHIYCETPCNTLPIETTFVQLTLMCKKRCLDRNPQSPAAPLLPKRLPHRGDPKHIRWGARHPRSRRARARA